MQIYGTAKERQEPHQITDGIWMWSTKLFGKEGGFCNSYLVQTGENESVLIDPLFTDAKDNPLMEWSVFDNLPEPQTMWLTNSDHERDSNLFRKQFGIPLEIAKAELGELSQRPDQCFSNNDTLQGNWRVIHLRDQKTPEECAF